ncbi:SHOCT domain-containing protein [Haloglomus litoreum]|uniref:SHOCT domain-containing protein n=1 Tax=Haloglomus litoreum TaxID=3034026 RepID=UPI0023E844D1|nr:SHOCT domain-containing protein [Haloglomus sp. DT116]
MVDRTDHAPDPTDHTVGAGDAVDDRDRSPEPREQLAEAFLPTVAVTVTAAVVISAILGTGLTTLVAAVGYLLLVPLAAFLQEPLVTMVRDDDPVDEQQAALDRLRDRYASGEIDELEFERRLERLLETETVEDAAARGRRDVDRGGATAPERGETTPEAEET